MARLLQEIRRGGRDVEADRVGNQLKGGRPSTGGLREGAGAPRDLEGELVGQGRERLQRRRRPRQLERQGPLGVGQGERPAAVALQDGTEGVQGARHGHRAEGLDLALPGQIISRPDIRAGYAPNSCR